MQWSKNYRANQKSINRLIGEAKNLYGDPNQAVYFEILIVKISSLIEVSFRDILSDYCDEYRDNNIQRFIFNQIGRHFNAPRVSDINKWLRSFNESWEEEFKTFCRDAKDYKIKESLDGLMNMRNKVAHTHEDIDIPLDTLEDYNQVAQFVIEKIAKIVLGETTPSSLKNQEQPA